MPINICLILETNGKGTA